MPAAWAALESKGAGGAKCKLTVARLAAGGWTVVSIPPTGSNTRLNGVASLDDTDTRTAWS